MLSRQKILWALVLLPHLLPLRAEANDALRRYHGRLDEIASHYNQQLSEIRMNRRRPGLEKTSLRSAEPEIRQLAMRRNQAVAEARLIYLKEQKSGDPGALSKLSRERVETRRRAEQPQEVEDELKAFWARVARFEPAFAELWAKRLHALEDEQSAFWAGAASKDEQVTKLWAARIQAVEEELTAFWARRFPAPETSQTTSAPGRAASGASSETAGS